MTGRQVGRQVGREGGRVEGKLAVSISSPIGGGRIIFLLANHMHSQPTQTTATGLTVLDISTKLIIQWNSNYAFFSLFLLMLT